MSIQIVIGSWGSYNECNERALGSTWLNLADYSDWDEITDELETQGFILYGIDEELFIQYIEGLPSNSCNWDFMNPQTLFETLNVSGALQDDYKLEVMEAYLEVMSYDDFASLVDSYGERWDDDINLYKGYDWDDYGREIFECCCYEIPERLESYINFERYGEDMGQDCAHEYSGGIIEIRY